MNELVSIIITTYNRLDLLQKALIRIKNGTYGICKDSGKLIGWDGEEIKP